VIFHIPCNLFKIIRVPYVVVPLYCVQRAKMIGGYFFVVDIGGIVDHHCLSFLFVIANMVLHYIILFLL